MSIRNLDEAEVAVRELLRLEDPRAQLRAMPSLIASCLDAEAREFLEGAQHRISERAGTRIIRKPVVIPPDPETRALEAPPLPAPLPPESEPEPRPEVRPAPEPAPARAPEPVRARSPAARADAEERKPAVPKLKPFSDKSKPKPAAGGATMRTSDPAAIAAELLSADDPEARPLPAFASRPAERTDVVTLLGEEDIVGDDAMDGARLDELPKRRSSAVRRERPRAQPRPAPAPAPRAPTPVSEVAEALAAADTASPEDTLSPSETLPEGTVLAPPTRVIPRPPPAPEPPAAAPEDGDNDDNDDDRFSDPAMTLPPDAIFADDLPDSFPEFSDEPQVHSDQPQAFTRDQVAELPADLVAQLGAAETLRPDTVFRRDLSPELLAATAEPAPPLTTGDAVHGSEDDNDVDDDDVDDDDVDDDDDDDVMELGADAIMEEGTPPHAPPASSIDMRDLLASLPPMPELDAAAVITMPSDATRAVVAAPVGSRERDPEEVFDSIELALRTGTLPLEAGREGLSDDEAGSLFQAFLSTNAEAARAADPSRIGEDTIVMDKPAAPAVIAGAGGTLDAVALYRVIRRIFDETHQKLPTWLIARTILTAPEAVYALVLDALQLRQSRDFIGYKESVADLFQRILATRLKWGKEIEATERWLRREVVATAAGADRERLETAVDAVLISDKRLAEARGYQERGREGARAALSLLESLDPGREA